MCELTLCNLNNKTLNTIMGYLLASVGSVKNDDGFGFMYGNEIWKTELEAGKIKNIGEIIFSKVKDDSAIPFHVRAATYGIPVVKENAHPFKGKHFVLMHNGTLISEDPKDVPVKDKDKDSDSLRFLNELDSCKDTKPDASFEDIFNDAMKKFCGKFAFIIRDIDLGTIYVVRGSTAALYISEMREKGSTKKKPDGYIINTNNETINKCIHDFVNLAGLITGKQYEFSDPKVLEKETIYIAKTTEISAVGKSPEKAAPVKEKANNAFKGFLPVNKGGITNKVAGNVEDILSMSSRVHNFLNKNSLSVLDFQIIIGKTLGISLLEMTKEDLSFFVESVMQKLSASKKIRNTMRKVLNGDPFPIALYKQFDLEFPWTVNEFDKLKKVVTFLEKNNNPF